MRGSIQTASLLTKNLPLMKFLRFILLCTLCFLTACHSKRVGPSFVPTFTESKRSLFKIKEDQTYTFGYLEVPENRSVPNSRTIKLPVYYFKSRNPNPQPDPIIYTVGGPGSTTMPSAQYMAYYRYLDDRDFILLEQRGTAYAQPHLDCPEWAEAEYQSNLPGVEEYQSDSLFARAAAACRNRLIRKGIDLTGYRTTEIAADIADLRKTLGIDQYNLLTISYSTKIAQVLLRDHPQGIRSVVMDSPLPLSVNYDEESVRNLLEAVEKLLADCESDPECNQTFPRLKDRFWAYLQQITEEPLAISVENPGTGKEETFYLRGADLLTVFTAASTADVPNIPWEMEQVLKGKLGTIQAQLATLFEKPGSGAGMGMRLSVWCAEEQPFVSQAVVAAETKRYPQTRGLSPAVFEANICRIWRVKPAEEQENQAVHSQVPILFISGEYDNETPPKWAAVMQQTFQNSYHFIFKGWKHIPTTNWSNPCAMNLAHAFFADPARKPELDCFERIEEPPFRLE
jgi:pimeloyl-ACP methyl ester carboxylesterase